MSFIQFMEHNNHHNVYIMTYLYIMTIIYFATTSKRATILQLTLYLESAMPEPRWHTFTFWNWWKNQDFFGEIWDAHIKNTLINCLKKIKSHDEHFFFVSIGCIIKGVAEIITRWTLGTCGH